MSEDAERQETEQRDAEENRQDRPRTALEEVMREIEEAERRTDEERESRRGRGEAGEAITPNTRAQEESHGD
ncbi:MULTISPECIES: hypothetical protein [Streptomyces]|uniref:Small hydrophilic protein n=2 Tax=Streptomyces TaxID=1883 RepID=A0ABW9IFH5_STRGJ|nr:MULTISPECIES: hypothetical protein [Streptomyces]MCX5528142.1 hypothetical protein [Streptomyces bobili]QEU69517.1 hypothetical protein CP966_32770 [Streptomyces galilaeus]GGW39584.1 hypothetical protein GCM10010350_24020 [Streptomyces galilaeus]